MLEWGDSIGGRHYNSFGLFINLIVLKKMVYTFPKKCKRQLKLKLLNIFSCSFAEFKICYMARFSF